MHHPLPCGRGAPAFGTINCLCSALHHPLPLWERDAALARPPAQAQVRGRPQAPTYPQPTHSRPRQTFARQSRRGAYDAAEAVRILPMEWDQGLWANVRRAVWTAGAGMLGGAAVLWAFGPQSVWFALGGSVIGAGLLSFITGRRRKREDPHAATEVDPNGLPSLAREIFERLPDPLMLVDLSGRIVFANQAMTASRAPTRRTSASRRCCARPPSRKPSNGLRSAGEPATDRVFLPRPRRPAFRGLYRAHGAGAEARPRCCCTT